MIDQFLANISGDMLLSVGGAATFCVVITQWLKTYLPSWRWTNLLALGVTIVFCEAAVWVYAEHTAQNFLNGLVWAVMGAGVATLGYETILNALGEAGIGPRKNT